MKSKITNRYGAAAFAVAAVLAVSGCAQKPQLSGKIIDEDASSSSGLAAGSAASAGEVGFAKPSGEISDERNADGLLQKRSVYFELDKSAVSGDHLSMLEAHAEFLLRNPGKGVLLEGNADNRGSNEYNLALGQRRADAVRDIMFSNGVSENQLESLSFGEEKPRALGNTEAAWAENRRVDIRYRDE